MITVEQFIENNNEEERICIAVYGRQQYDEFMAFLSSAGYTWQGKADLKENTPTYIQKLFDMPDKKFVILIYINSDYKTITTVSDFYDDGSGESGFDYCFANEKDDNSLDEDFGSNYIIKPFLRLKREAIALGLWM